MSTIVGMEARRRRRSSRRNHGKVPAHNASSWPPAAEMGHSYRYIFFKVSEVNCAQGRIMPLEAESFRMAVRKRGTRSGCWDCHGFCHDQCHRQAASGKRHTSAEFEYAMMHLSNSYNDTSHLSSSSHRPAAFLPPSCKITNPI
jgi:hypothetical protein